MNAVTLNSSEYTSREKIKLETVILNENKIKVATDHTLYVSFEKVEKVDTKSLIKLHALIVKTCKENKIKISYRNKSKGILTASKVEYEAQYNRYSNLFNQLLEGWKIKLEEGLYMGTSDDKYLNDVLVPISFEITAMFYRNTVMSKVREIERHLKDVYRQLQEMDDYYKVNTVYL